MSEPKSEAKTPRKRKAPAKAKDVRVEVLRHGFRSLYGTAARNARINMKKADADMFAKSGDVRILGTIE